MTEKRWYTYLLCYPDTEEPFYVGKGTGNRINTHELLGRSERNEQKMQAIRAIQASGKQVLKKKIAHFDNELDAYIYEWAMINAYHEQITNIQPWGQPRTSEAEHTLRLTKEFPWGIREVTCFLGCSRPQALRLVHRLGLPYNQWGDATSPLRFRPEEVRDWAIRNKIVPRKAVQN